MEKFQFVMEHINHLSIPMLRIDGRLYITQQALSSLLGIDNSTIRHTYRNRRDEFDSVCVYSIHAIDFIKENKHLLGLKYVRGDMHLWSEHDMLVFTMLVRGENGRRIRQELIQVIIDNAKQKVISKKEYDLALLDRDNMKSRLTALEEEIELARPILKELAKMSGKSLQAQRGTKTLRDIN